MYAVRKQILHHEALYCHMSSALLTSSKQLGKLFHYGIQAFLSAAPTHK